MCFADQSGLLIRLVPSGGESGLNHFSLSQAEYLSFLCILHSHNSPVNVFNNILLLMFFGLVPKTSVTTDICLLICPLT